MLGKPGRPVRFDASRSNLPKATLAQADVGATQLMQSYPWTVSKFGRRRPRPGSRRLIGPVMLLLRRGRSLFALQALP
jgi:hypothetical protein